MGNKQTTTQNQTQNQSYDSTSTYDFLNPPDTADISALRSHKFRIDPSIGYRIGGAVRRMRDTFQNPFGPNTTPQIRAATERSQERELMQEGGAQARAGAYDVNNQEYGQKLAVAGMTAPRLVQSGQKGTASGSMSGKATSSSPWYNDAIQGGASIGSALLM